ncbi:hypothetical protein OPQ81_008701 [Rhizoctonia solani]|nr:hypothetical protein OPQ81_008701 [Rhizoctonia solani]
MGKPTDEDMKTIHAVMRSLNAVAHLPALYSSDLSMQLSQHLFGAQMAVYRANHSTGILPGGRGVYTPPVLPSHIPGTLKRVVGAPSDEDIKSAQSALRSVDNLAINPQLFDADLGMKLSQHLFNLQFARYMHDSVQASFAPDSEMKTGEPLSAQELTQEPQEALNVNREIHDPMTKEQNNAQVPRLGQALGMASEPAQWGEAMKQIKDEIRQSRDVLENMNRVLISIQRTQTTVGFWGGSDYYVYQNPVNRRGVLATECDLPQLRHLFIRHVSRTNLSLKPDQIVRYLKFFDIGADLIQDGEEPKLVDGKEGEARRLLLKQVGFLGD